jgi:hypothetical protein
MAWIVKHCMRDYEDVWKHEAGRCDTEEEAEALADKLRWASPWPSDWYEVSQEDDE